MHATPTYVRTYARKYESTNELCERHLARAAWQSEQTRKVRQALAAVPRRAVRAGRQKPGQAAAVCGLPCDCVGERLFAFSWHTFFDCCHATNCHHAFLLVHGARAARTGRSVCFCGLLVRSFARSFCSRVPSATFLWRSRTPGAEGGDGAAGAGGRGASRVAGPRVRAKRKCLRGC